MRSFVNHLIITTIVGALVVGLSFTRSTAQIWYSPEVYGTSFLNYGYGGGIDPLFGGFNPIGNYSYPFLSPMNIYTNLYYLGQIYEVYNYLNYCLHFYEIARQTPCFYLYDQTADYMGANIYNYAITLNVTPQEAILYFMKKNFL